MSRLTDLLNQARNLNPQLAADLEAEVRTLTQRRTFGLVFEPHQPEAVQLPHHPVRRGNKVRVLPARGETKRGDQRLWRVQSIHRATKLASIIELDAEEPETKQVPIENLVVVAEFQDTIFPGLKETGRVERGGDKPFHTVLNAENFHALELLTFTHRHRVDAIYIDPPYNTGAKDWKYNNDYVVPDDSYRHSKWLAFMERRLKIARELLNPENSVLIVTIDEKEYLRLGLLLEQTFPEGRIQMVSSVINPKGVSISGGFRRADEYIYFVMFGESSPVRLQLTSEWSASVVQNQSIKKAMLDSEPAWTSMMRRGSNSARADRPKMFYPIYVEPNDLKIVSVGEHLPIGISEAPQKEGLVAVLPLRSNGLEGRWQIGAEELISRIQQGRVRVGRATSYGFVINYLPDGAYSEVLNGSFEVLGKAIDGSLIAKRVGEGNEERIAPTQWKIASHNASEHGSTLLRTFLSSRRFPFPKSLYAVEDALRFFVKDKPEAIILDFFSGSGTTAHAVMRLNRQDGGRRQCISVTNNEVGADEHKKLLQDGLRPGDPAWEKWGICDYITKPRIKAAITGETPDGKPIQGDYKFTDEFPMAEGFEENAAFFTLTYEAPLTVSHHKAFERIAPLLWLRAGTEGRIVTDLGERGWDVSERYGVLQNLDDAAAFLTELEKNAGVRLVYVITDDDTAFQMVCRDLPGSITSVRLYESYLQNFRINSGRMG
ncbi:site-specific DNA-methyltransferase [Deinococcus sp. 43]|uniref:site-specific DNA-methyltransferase n=1 Tax=Deinococcus sp. 43 TaxID=532020 RepID=UPI0024DE5620|nr:DNA methyltransferase [Deinococcus sp. 43]MDK2014425.1 DNA methyltransferase [Deinococcus sp. 43]